MDRNADVLRAAQLITENMTWAYTVEGSDYWNYVYGQLQRLGQGYTMLSGGALPTLRNLTSSVEHYDGHRARGLKEAAELLKTSFTWTDAPEGYNFWADVYGRCLNKSMNKANDAPTWAGLITGASKLLLIEDEERRRANGLEKNA
jgi:hypothetical protein